MPKILNDNPPKRVGFQKFFNVNKLEICIEKNNLDPSSEKSSLEGDTKDFYYLRQVVSEAEKIWDKHYTKAEKNVVKELGEFLNADCFEYFNDSRYFSVIEKEIEAQQDKNAKAALAKIKVAILQEILAEIDSNKNFEEDIQKKHGSRWKKVLYLLGTIFSGAGWLAEGFNGAGSILTIFGAAQPIVAVAAFGLSLLNNFLIYNLEGQAVKKSLGVNVKDVNEYIENLEKQYDLMEKIVQKIKDLKVGDHAKSNDLKLDLINPNIS